jgi:hypothetical protein
LAALDSFDDRYLGQKASDPTVDNDGNPLVTGALYFNTTDDVMKVYEGSVWVAAYASLSGALLVANNLADLNSAAAARTNLGLGTAATTASTDYATAAQGVLADSALQSSDIGVSVQGYSAVLTGTTASYTTAEETKLAGIETGATADQTAGEIKTAYESNANTNAFTDAEQTKLAGIEAGADVTDTTNVTAAGALMDSELTNITAVKALNQGVATTDSPNFAGLTVDTNTLYVDSTNDRVGIGVSSPSEQLHVASLFPAIKLDNTGSGGNSWRIASGSTASGFAGKLQVYNEDTANVAMMIDSGGNVGIGTSSPSANLDIQAASDIWEILKVQNTGGSRSSLIRTIGAAGGSVDFGASGGTASTAIIRTGGTERMTIDSSGNVGIGTSSPVGGLHINTSTRTLNLASPAAGGGGASTIMMGNNDSGGTAGPNVIVSANRNLLFGVGNSFSNAAGGTTTEYMRIDSSGNVLVGKTSASYTIAGAQMEANGVIGATVNNNQPMFANRLSSDGSIFGFYKDGTTVGSIGTTASELTIGLAGAGIRFNGGNSDIIPWNVSTNAASTTTDLGNAGNRFKDLYLSGNVYLGGAIDETVYALSGTTPALDPSNGTIQTHTLSGNTTYSDSLSAGESITIMIDDGAGYTVTWPTMTWVNNGGSAPTLATSGYTTVALWKVSTTLYGALVGDGS